MSGTGRKSDDSGFGCFLRPALVDSALALLMELIVARAEAQQMDSLYLVVLNGAHRFRDGFTPYDCIVRECSIGPHGLEFQDGARYCAIQLWPSPFSSTADLRRHGVAYIQPGDYIQGVACELGGVIVACNGRLGDEKACMFYEWVCRIILSTLDLLMREEELQQRVDPYKAKYTMP